VINIEDLISSLFDAHRPSGSVLTGRVVHRWLPFSVLSEAKVLSNASSTQEGLGDNYSIGIRVKHYIFNRMSDMTGRTMNVSGEQLFPTSPPDSSFSPGLLNRTNFLL
jgi:hypothetical protein